MNLRNHLIDLLVRCSQKEHSPALRALATVLGAALFMAGIPAFVFWCAPLFGGIQIMPLLLARILSVVCFTIGIPWMLSAVAWQLVRGKGTPVPVVPTKHFLQNGPYRYVRNPMMLGFFLYLLGWIFLWNQLGSLLGGLLVMSLLLAEIKWIEEPELEKRFGRAYREYKKETPFLFPRWVK